MRVLGTALSGLRNYIKVLYFMERILRFCSRPVILLAILCAVTYYPTLNSEFKLDDFTYFKMSPNFDFTKVWHYFVSTTDQHYNPLNSLFNAVIFSLWDTNVVAYHLLNLSLFYLNGLLLYKICLLLTKNNFAAIFSAVFFCLHPINAQIMNQIVFNTVLMSAALMQLSIIFYDHFLEKNRSKDFLIAFVCTILAFLLLETTWILPLYFMLWAYYFRRVNYRKIIISTLPFWITVFILFSIWCNLTQGNGLSSLIADKVAYLNISPMVLLGTWAFLWLRYISKLFIPIDDVWIYAVRPLQESQAIFYIVLLLSLFLLLLIFFRKIILTRIHRLACMWFILGFIFFFPGSFAHVAVGLVIESYWFYFGSMGFFILAGIWISGIKTKVSKNFFIALISFLLGYLFFCTQIINFVARTEKRYCNYWLNISLNPVPLTSVAKIAFNENQYSQAIKYYEIYLNEFSASPYAVYPPIDIYTSLAGVYLKMGDLHNAHKYIDQAFAINPHYARAYAIRAQIFVTENEYQKAENDFLQNLKYNSTDYLSKVNLADLYLIMKQDAKAIPILKDLTRISF